MLKWEGEAMQQRRINVRLASPSGGELFEAETPTLIESSTAGVNRCSSNSLEFDCEWMAMALKNGILGVQDARLPVDGGKPGSVLPLTLRLIGGSTVFVETDDSILVRADLDNKSVTVRPAGGHFEALPGAISMLSLVSQNIEPDRFIPDKYKKQFNATLAEAERRLGKEECAKLFGKSSKELIEMLRNTEYRYLPLPKGAPKYDPNTNTSFVVGAQTNSAKSVFINTRGSFFNNKIFVPGAPSNPVTFDFGSGLTGKEFGALLLLHELGHQVGIFGSDADDDKLNREYTRRVQKACF